jgi:2-polyprenyl-6-methoxyphenol hydroxylase-like FAD-dependent oxidoreductase
MTNREYDVIVVGCRVAGASTAMLLARHGLRVLAVDRASFPSDAISTHQVQIPGGAALRRWGILDALVSAGAPPARHVRFEGGGSVLDGQFPAYEGVDAVFSPRRTLLDAILVDAARAAGADVREGFTVDEIVIDGNDVRGIRGRQENGSTITERARVVVGADGKHSIVAQAVRAPVERELDARTVAAYAYWSGLPVKGGEVYQRERRALGLWPTNDELTLSYVAWPIAEFETFRSDIEGNLVGTMRAMGIGERLHGAERVERIRTTPDVPNVIRTPAGNGWVLVGDAGLVMDPITGQGIGHALLDAEMVADALVAGLGGERPLDDALADYRARRDAARIPMWEFTADVASFRPSKPEERVLFEALAKNQAQTDRFLGMITGAIPVREYLEPSNLRKIVGLRGFAKIAMGRVRGGRA